MHKRKHYPNPTAPVRCDAVDTDDEGVSTKCRRREYKAGMCTSHYKTWKAEKENRRVNFTVRKTGIDPVTGKNTYSGLGIIAETCVGKYHRCLRGAVIMYDKIAYCMKCFMKASPNVVKEPEEKVA